MLFRFWCHILHLSYHTLKSYFKTGLPQDLVATLLWNTCVHLFSQGCKIWNTRSPRFWGQEVEFTQEIEELLPKWYFLFFIAICMSRRIRLIVSPVCYVFFKIKIFPNDLLWFIHPLMVVWVNYVIYFQ